MYCFKKNESNKTQPAKSDTQGIFWMVYIVFKARKNAIVKKKQT